MKFGIRKFSPKKRLQARNPITQAKIKYSVAKYVDPVGTGKKRLYNKVYSKTSIDSLDSLAWIVPLISVMVLVGGLIALYKFIF